MHKRRNRGRNNVKAVHAIDAVISVDGADPVTVRAYIREMTDGRPLYDLTGHVGVERSIPPEGIAESAMSPALDGDADAINMALQPASGKVVPRDPDTQVEQIAQARDISIPGLVPLTLR